jgi:hypothetical protein
VAELKTRPNSGDVDTFLESLEEVRRREECRALVALRTF